MCLDNKVIQEGLKDFLGEVILYLMLIEKALHLVMLAECILEG